MREEGLLPALPRGAWVARLRARLAGRRARPVGRQPDGALDYDEILARARPPRNGDGATGERTMSAASEFVVVLVTAGSAEEAERIGRALVTEQLVGCVNVVGPIRSIYRWQGAVEDAEERLLIIKARAADLARSRRACAPCTRTTCPRSWRCR